MQQEIVQIMALNLTKGQSDCLMEMKPQLFLKKDLLSQQLLFKEANSNDKNQTLNQDFSSSSDSDSDVSFQEEILESHETALNLEIEKNESLFILQNSQSKCKRTILKVGSFYDTLYKTLTRLPNISSSIIQTFHFYLQKHENFKQFLNHIHCSYHDKVSNKLLQLSFMIWNLYRPLLGRNLKSAEILMITHDISLLLSSHQSILRKTKHQTLAPQIVKMRQHFINFFATTIVFVLEGFFKNPFFNDLVSADRYAMKQFGKTCSINSQMDEVEPNCRKLVKTELL